VPEIFAGVDCSTQSCKLVLIDLKKAEVLYADLVNYDVDLPQYNTKNGVEQNLEAGVSESNPLMWIDALKMLFNKLQQSNFALQEIKSISVSGQQHGLVCLDERGKLTRKRSKLWNDFSTQEECDLLVNSVGGPNKMIAEVGNSQRTGYTASKIFAFARNEPEAFQKTSTMFLVHNYLNWYLSGAENGGVRVMEPGDTSGMALWHPQKKIWSHNVMQCISQDLIKKLPPVLPSDRSIGNISQELVEQFGFSPHCRIDAGSGDNMYGAIGTGNVVPGIVTISLGTSGTAYAFSKKALIDPEGEIAFFCDSTGNYLPLLCVSNLANGYNTILKQYNISHLEFDEIVKLVNPGCNGRIVIPWFSGERTPDLPFGAPLYFGFNPGDFNKSYLCRAVLEGHILNLYNGFQRMKIQPKEIRLTGGLSKSDIWCQTIADVFETEVIPIEGEGAALGAALHAAWVFKKENGAEIPLAEIVKPFISLSENKRKFPIPSNVDRYSISKNIFDALSKMVRGKKSEFDPFKLRNKLIEM